MQANLLCKVTAKKQPCHSRTVSKQVLLHTGFGFFAFLDADNGDDHSEYQEACGYPAHYQHNERIVLLNIKSL